MHHGVQQDNVVGLKGDYGLEPRLLEKLLCNEPDAVAGTLQYKGSVPQVCQMDGLLLCQWVGGRQGHQQFFVGNGDVGDLAAGGTGAQCQVHQSPGDGSRLLGGIQLGEAQGDVRVPAGELVVDPAEDDGTRLGAVARRIALRLPPVTSFMVSSIRFCSSRIFWAHSTHTVPRRLGTGGGCTAGTKQSQKVRSHSARNLLSAEGETWSACAAWLRLPYCNGGKVIILTGVHSSSLLLQNGKKSDFSQKSAKCWGIWKSFSIISIKDHKRNCKLL